MSLVDKEFTTDEEMMSVAVEISAQNVTHETGGPFGCAIFERCKDTGTCKLFSVGANRVTALNNSTLHGEMTAIQFGSAAIRAGFFWSHRNLAGGYMDGRAKSGTNQNTEASPHKAKGFNPLEHLRFPRIRTGLKRRCKFFSVVV